MRTRLKSLTRSLKQLLTAVASRACATGSPDRLVHSFFQHGAQYYVAGRCAVFAGLMPVAGNLLHHAIEMLLKGALAKGMTSEKLKDKLGHRLRRAWKAFKERASDPKLDRFDRVVRELDKFESIRYPDELVRQGASISFDVTKAGAAQSSFQPGSVPHYALCLEEIDELVATIFQLASRNPKAYLSFVKPEALDYINRDNAHITL